jgi:hypothetical protein
MYPTGGYGNFLYCLLSEHLKSTVKLAHRNWEFRHGNSHEYPKYTESFLLGRAVEHQILKSFSYNYQVLDESANLQIQQGKNFLVLADVGNKGDNIKFLRKYFLNAKIVRVYATQFVEKLIVWANCMTKSNDHTRSSLYPGSIFPNDGIAAWANKPIENITDTDAIDCMVHFFQSDFGIYGKMFSAPAADAINIAVSSFFTKDDICQTMQLIARQLDTECVNQLQLNELASEFIHQQLPLSLLEPGNSFPLVREALARYGHTY